MVLGGERTELENNEIRTYSFYDTNQLFNWAFDNFTYQTLLREDDMVLQVTVSLSEDDHVVVHPKNDVEVLLPNDVVPEAVERVPSLAADPVEAPIAAGDVLGTMTLSYNGVELSRLDRDSLSLLCKVLREGGHCRSGGAGNPAGRLEADLQPPAVPVRP